VQQRSGLDADADAKCRADGEQDAVAYPGSQDAVAYP
jgi:hypothetical protein